MPSERSAMWMRRLQIIVPVVVIVMLAAIVLPALQQARESARRSTSKNNLVQLGLALHNYHDTFDVLPPGGTFDAGGRGHHGWTTFLDMYLAQSAFTILIDYKRPWDDPVNVDHFLKGPYVWAWQTPGLTTVETLDGFPVAHYAANQTLMHRNSSVRLSDLSTGTSTTAMAGDANGNFPPLGYPFNWRDMSLGLGMSPDGFGCPTRGITMVLMADGEVRTLTNRIDSEIAKALAGPEGLLPSSNQIDKPAEPYRLAIKDYWRYLEVVRGHKDLMRFRLTPDRKTLFVDFRNFDDPKEAVASKWSGYFHEFLKGAPVEHVELKGHLRANELVPFLELASLKRLTISLCTIQDDSESVLTKARAGIAID